MWTNIVGIKKLSDKAIIPKYQSSIASGFDFHSAEDVVINPGQTIIVKTDLSFSIPEGFEIQVRPRSGMSSKTKIRVANSPGTIDADFTGPVGIIIDNNGSEPFKINLGDRIAQGVLCPVHQAVFVENHTYEHVSTRKDGGFGSTGSK